MNMTVKEARGEAASGLLGTRAEALYRLKVGVGGLLAVLLVVAIASSVVRTTQQTDETQTAQTGADAAPEPANDPLVDIGVVPELPGDDKPVVQDLPADQMPPEAQDEAAPGAK